MAAARDLVTILYKPRETMRRILDGPGRRWTAEIIVLAIICSSYGDPDVRRLRAEFDLAMMPFLASIALIVLFTAFCWVIVIYVIAWLVTIVGRFLDGKGTVADVRAAMAWALVPLIWSVLYRIPIGLWVSGLTITHRNGWQLVMELLEQGVLSIALIVIAIKLVVDLWILSLAAINVSEALQFETWKGFSAVAAVAAAPLVVVAAAVIAFNR